MPLPDTANLWAHYIAGTGTFQNIDGTTVADDDGEVVGYWTDQSGNGRHLIAGGNDTTRPTIQTNEINTSLPCVRFDGSNDMLLTADSALAPPFCMFIVVRIITSNYFDAVLGERDAKAQGFSLTIDNVGTGRCRVQGGTGGYAQTGPLALNTWGIFDFDESRTATNNVASGAAATYTSTLDALRVGDSPEAGFGFAECDIAEIIVYSSNKSDSEVQPIYDYLNEKYFGQRVGTACASITNYSGVGSGAGAPSQSFASLGAGIGSWNQFPPITGRGLVPASQSFPILARVSHGFSQAIPFGGGGVATHNAHGPAELDAQVLFDSVQVYPGWGDGFGLLGGPGPGDFGDWAELRIGAILRGHAAGIVQNTSHEPFVGIPVELLTGGGSGTTDIRGAYLTGADFAKGTKSYDVHPVVGASTLAITETFRNRLRNRAAFMVAGGGEWVSYDVSDSLRQYRAYNNGSVIYFGAASNIAATTWEDVDTGVTGYEPDIRVDPQSPAQLIHLAYRDSGSLLYDRYTLDEGVTWTMPTTIPGTGLYPRQCITRDGRRFYYWLASGGSIVGALYDAQGTLMYGGINAIGAGVDSTAFDVDERADAQGAWNIHITYFAGGALYDANSPDGITFS